MSAAPILAFDLGTDTAAMALVTGDDVRFLAEPGSGLLNWSSAICLDGDEIVVGTAAENRRQSRPTGYRAEIKRDLARGPVRLGDQDVEPLDLVVAVLRQARAVASRDAGAPVEHVLLTVPASYHPGDPRWDLMIAAGTTAGFSVVELIAEPEAAALAPAAGPPFPPGSLVLVYDLGGGTFDTALIRVGENTPLRTASADGCCGRDLDAAVYADLLEQVGVPQPDLHQRTQLTDLVRLVKHDLTERTTATFAYAGTGGLVTYDRDRLEGHAAPLLKRTLDCCRRVLADAGVDARQVHGVLLTGGVTRMPAVAATVAAELRIPVRHARDPQYAVVAGAARHAADRTGRALTAQTPGRTGTPLRWTLPSGTGTLLTWDVAVGRAFEAGRPLGRIRVHDGAVWDLVAPRAGVVLEQHAEPGALVCTGDWLVTAGQLAGPATAGKLTCRLVETHPAAKAGAAALTGDGRLLAALAEGRTLRVVDLRDGTEVLSHRDKPICGVRFDPAGERLGVAVDDGSKQRLTLWDLATGEQVASIRRDFDLDWAPLGDDRVLISAAESYPGKKDPFADVVDMRTNKSVGAVPQPRGGTQGRAKPIGTGGRLAGLEHGYSIHSACLLTYDAAGVPAAPRLVTGLDAGLDDDRMVLAAAVDGTCLASADDQGWVRVFRAPAENEKKIKPAAVIGHAPGGVTALAFSTDGRHLIATGAGLVTVWELEWEQ
ncbi:Hsp70 family protein [Actinoplanes bogorensis]|uniref:Hsp70 family protein n=1 Tax=Paractinoplanes bogorensis TaxID=1610840 RepID=A0ABS5YUN5_9ACTN|nr:Hsp70 family protein [Actinoplanes bogorensis]MBU2667168.1 Hsp70 family protein [Actinoplanes bogorensis]